MEGIEFSKTFAPVTKFNTIGVILALVVAMSLGIHHMDMKTTFFNGNSDVEIYMQ